MIVSGGTCRGFQLVGLLVMSTADTYPTLHITGWTSMALDGSMWGDHMGNIFLSIFFLGIYLVSYMSGIVYLIKSDKFEIKLKVILFAIWTGLLLIIFINNWILLHDLWTNGIVKGLCLCEVIHHGSDFSIYFLYPWRHCCGRNLIYFI